MKLRTLTVGLVMVICATALAGCGSSLSASSTCQDFLNASPSAQQQVVDQLAAQYRKPDYATPLGEPEVPYFCASNPSVTLGQFFAEAQD
jgi:hypothetical protein